MSLVSPWIKQVFAFSFCSKLKILFAPWLPELYILNHQTYVYAHSCFLEPFLWVYLVHGCCPEKKDY